MGFGSAKKAHTDAGRRAAKAIEAAAANVHSSVEGGACTAALLNYADMQREIGHAEAHMRAGGSVLIPHTTIVEAADKFVNACVRYSGSIGGVGARKRRR